MRIYIHLGEEKFELEDAYSIQEPLLNQSFFLEKNGEKKRYTITRVDNTFMVSGKSIDTIKDIYLE